MAKQKVAQFTYQLEREALRKSVNVHIHHLKGRCLDVGSEARKSRYYGLIMQHATDYKSLDVMPEFDPDIVASAEAIPVNDGSFDSILCTQALCNVPRPHVAVEEFRRILTPGGIVLVSMPVIGMYRGPHDLWRFTPAGLKFLLEDHGFEVFAIEPVGIGIFSVTNQMFNRFVKTTLGLQYRGFSRKVFNKTAILFGWIAKKLDRLMPSGENQKYIMNVVVVAKKL